MCVCDRQWSNRYCQRGLFEFAERFLPQLAYKKRAHIMNPMLPNLLGDKMSSSHPPSTKVMFLDSPETIRKKISDAYSAGDAAANAVLGTLRDILFPASELRLDGLESGGLASSAKGQGIMSGRQPFCTEDAPAGTIFSVRVDGQDGRGYRHYGSYDDLEQELAEKKLPADSLMAAIADALSDLLEPVRKMYEESAEWQDVDRLAYPKPA